MLQLPTKINRVMYSSLALLCLSFNILVSSKIFAFPVDDNQNKEILLLKNQIQSLAKELKDLKDQQRSDHRKLLHENNNYSSQANSSGTKSAKNKNNVTNNASNQDSKNLNLVDLEIIDINNKIGQLQKAVKNGVDLSVVQDQLITLRSRLNQLKAEQAKLQKTAISNPDNQNSQASKDSNASETTPWYLDNSLAISGVMSFDASIGKNKADQDTSDFLVSSLEFSIQKSFSSSVDGQIVFLYEEGETDLGVDQAFLNSRWGDVHQLTLSFGHRAVPLSVNETKFVSDTLNQTITELNETLLLLQYEWNHFSLGTYAYNGQSALKDQPDAIKSFGFFSEYYNSERFWGILERARISFLNNAADIDQIYAVLYEHDELTNNPGIWSFQTTLGYENFSLIAEYSMLSDAFSTQNMQYDNQEANLSTLQTELHYTFDDQYSFQIGLQNSQDGLGFDLPKKRYIAGLTWEINKNMNLNIEHRIDTDYDNNHSARYLSEHSFSVKNGTGKVDRVTTVQWKVVFF